MPCWIAWIEQKPIRYIYRHLLMIKVMEMLKRLNAEEGVTTIVVTHESGVANETNKIVHIKDGIIGKIEENLDHTARPFGINGIMK